MCSILSYQSLIDSKTVKTIRLAVIPCTSQIVRDLLSNRPRKESQQPENKTASPLTALTDGRDITSPPPLSPLPPQTAGFKFPSLPSPLLSEILYSCHCSVSGTFEQLHVDLMQVFSAPEL